MLDLTDKMNAVDENAQYLLDMTTKVVNSYTSHLTGIMNNIYNDIVNQDNPPIEVIEKYFLQLSNAIYFIAENTESVGIFDGVSKAAALQAYNDALMESQSSIGSNNKKPTVAESTAYAQKASLEDTMINEVYSRAYKMIKSKLDAAQVMTSTLSKVLSKRMAEMQFSNVNNNNRQILNEEVYSNNNKPF